MESIEGHEKVTSIFGRWPSFHDGEVEAFGLEWDEEGLNVRLLIRGWESTGEVDGKGFYRLHKHMVVEMVFHGCTELQLQVAEGFLNIVFGLRIEGVEEEPPLAISLHGIGGIEATFRCVRAAVVSAVPYTPEPEN